MPVRDPAAAADATWEGAGRLAIQSALRDHPELVALAFVLVGLAVRPKGALGTAWWGGTAIGSLIALVAVLRRGGK